MKIGLLGAKGNMGRRYSAILNAMNLEYDAVDIGDRVGKYDYAIIATPTLSHVQCMMDVLAQNENCHILCEKPLTTNMDELKRFFASDYKERLRNLKMVNNYDYAYTSAVSDSQFINPTGLTKYDYYNTGNDGLLWDCIQLIKMAKGEITLSKKSYYWSVCINGWSIDRRTIDHSYAHMIKEFIGGQMESEDLDHLLNLHLFIGRENAKRTQRDLFCNDREYWSSGQNNIKAISS